jgi:hypothetical protein
MKSQGIVMFAHNNETVDYVKQAIFCCCADQKTSASASDLDHFQSSTLK